MTNLGHVGPGKAVFDPFVGTGAILLICALQGAYCFGTDIDVRVLRGSDQNNMFSNFSQFGLPRPELVRSDNALHHRHYRADVLTPMVRHRYCRIPFLRGIKDKETCSLNPCVNRYKYHAIISDPPYGIRAGGRRSGSRKPLTRPVQPISDEHRLDHIPQTQPYPVDDVMADLLDVAARTLIPAVGRLVYVIPSYAKDFDLRVDLPQHPGLDFLHACYQPLSTTGLGRRIVVLRRNELPYDPSQREANRRSAWPGGPAAAAKCASIREKIEAVARTKPNYDKKLVRRREKRKQLKQEKRDSKRTVQPEGDEASSGNSS
jgi:tRNA (guanine10-N2)-methyltransferase